MRVPRLLEYASPLREGTSGAFGTLLSIEAIVVACCQVVAVFLLLYDRLFGMPPTRTVLGFTITYHQYVLLTEYFAVSAVVSLAALLLCVLVGRVFWGRRADRGAVLFLGFILLVELLAVPPMFSH